MENSVLNKAHLAARKAVKLAKKGLYSEAALCHIEAAQCFQELESKISSESTSVVRSLEEQSKYHRRQAELVQKIGDIAGKQKLRATMSKNTNASAQLGKQSSAVAVDSELQKNFEQFDSLLQILHTDIKTPKPVVEYTLRPKRDADVIEELETVNRNLRLLVAKLMEELRVEREEKIALQKRLEMYEPKNKSRAANFMALMDQIPTAVPDLAPLETPECNY